MKILAVILAIGMVFSSVGMTFAVDEDDDSGASSKKDSGASTVLTTAVLGGLLGGGLGAAIGSASGHAGTGALIGAGVGAVGGTVVGANQAANDTSAGSYPVETTNKVKKASDAGSKTSKDPNIKKRIVREYDEEGNVISEKEVKN